jgi:histidine triad (HIT) family protein
VLETQRTLAFRDISPQAPIHVLVIPKAHYWDLADLGGADGELLAEVAPSWDVPAVAISG